MRVWPLEVLLKHFRHDIRVCRWVDQYGVVVAAALSCLTCREVLVDSGPVGQPPAFTVEGLTDKERVEFMEALEG